MTKDIIISKLEELGLMKVNEDSYTIPNTVYIIRISKYFTTSKHYGLRIGKIHEKNLKFMVLQEGIGLIKYLIQKQFQGYEKIQSIT